MCKFLTGKARLQQVDAKRMWKLLDNEVFKANDGRLYMAPRTMYTDNYTIPLWAAPLAGSPVDFDTRCCHVHDLLCYCHEALMIDLTEKDLRDKGYLKFSDKNNMWVCEDIPTEYLSKRKVGKIETNNILYECMEAADVPLIDRWKIRAGVALNVNWHIYLLTGKVFELDLSRVYDEEYWRENVLKR